MSASGPGGVCLWSRATTPWADTPQADTPPSRHPPQQTLPSKHDPWADTPPNRHPFTAQCMLGFTPLPLIDRMTDACENITFQQLLLQTVMILKCHSVFRGGEPSHMQV